MSAIVTSSATASSVTTTAAGATSASATASAVVEPMTTISVGLLLAMLFLGEMVQAQWERLRLEGISRSGGLLALVHHVRAPLQALSVVFVAIVVERVIRFS